MSTRVNHAMAVFDFDGTLTHRDSMFPFLRMIAGNARFLINIAQLSPVLACYGIGKLPNNIAKERVLNKFLDGLGIVELRELGRHFAETKLCHLLRHRAMERLRWHQSRGDRCILLSASLDIYLQPWADLHGIHHVLCSSLEVDNSGRVTGKLANGNCYGEEKVRCLKNLLTTTPHSPIYAYGDSPGDRPVLEYADFGYYREFPGEDVV